MYYQSPAFADRCARHARNDHDAAHQWLSVSFEQLRESFRKLSPELTGPVPLSQFLDGPLSIEQLVAMIRTYAKKLSDLLLR